MKANLKANLPKGRPQKMSVSRSAQMWIPCSDILISLAFFQEERIVLIFNLPLSLGHFEPLDPTISSWQVAMLEWHFVFSNFDIRRFDGFISKVSS